MADKQCATPKPKDEETVQNQPRHSEPQRRSFWVQHFACGVRLQNLSSKPPGFPRMTNSPLASNLIIRTQNEMQQARSCYVYIMSGPSETLYTGVTGDLEHRVYEHKHKVVRGFTKRFNINRLLYYEEFDQVYDAIAREKQIKGLLRVKKLSLIRQLNPDFEDLSKDWESL